MTDKELIKQEIEYRLSSGKYSINSKQALEDIIVFIDSLPEEPASEDLEEEINYIGKNEYFDFSDWKSIARHFAEWQKQKDLEDLFKSDMTMPNKFYEKGKADAMKEMKETLQTEYEKGRFDMREEMMEDAIECVVEDWCGDSPEIIIPLNPQDFKTGNKVKIVILKTE